MRTLAVDGLAAAMSDVRRGSITKFEVGDDVSATRQSQAHL